VHNQKLSAYIPDILKTSRVKSRDEDVEDVEDGEDEEEDWDTLAEGDCWVLVKCPERQLELLADVTNLIQKEFPATSYQKSSPRSSLSSSTASASASACSERSPFSPSNFIRRGEAWKVLGKFYSAAFSCRMGAVELISHVMYNEEGYPTTLSSSPATTVPISSSSSSSKILASSAIEVANHAALLSSLRSAQASCWLVAINTVPLKHSFLNKIHGSHLLYTRDPSDVHAAMKKTVALLYVMEEVGLYHGLPGFKRTATGKRVKSAKQVIAEWIGEGVQCQEKTYLDTDMDSSTTRRKKQAGSCVNQLIQELNALYKFDRDEDKIKACDVDLDDEYGLIWDDIEVEDIMKDCTDDYEAVLADLEQKKKKNSRRRGRRQSSKKEEDEVGEDSPKSNAELCTLLILCGALLRSGILTESYQRVMEELLAILEEQDHLGGVGEKLSRDNVSPVLRAVVDAAKKLTSPNLKASFLSHDERKVRTM
tara:strand:+ start:248 stop:1690 length:1443 start_codon:yes stop_codon:yes gene_type:complete